MCMAIKMISSDVYALNCMCGENTSRSKLLYNTLTCVLDIIIMYTCIDLYNFSFDVDTIIIE